MVFSPCMVVNVFNNIPITTSKTKSGITFLHESVAPGFTSKRELNTIENKLVEYVFGPIFLRSRFTYIKNLIAQGDLANLFNFKKME